MPETGFLDRTTTLAGVSYGYQVYVPRGFSRDRAWPVVLFLHGAGERGDDGLVQTEVGLGGAIRRHARRFPMLAVFPQAARRRTWRGEMATLAVQALDEVVDEFGGDRRRLYLTGLSMGGSGTVHLALRCPGRFAALVPVCGEYAPRAGRRTGGRPGDPLRGVAEALKDTSVWVFHGAEDDAIPPTESRRLVAALRRAGGRVRYTEYRRIGHDAWDRAYAEPGLVPWLLAQRLPD